MEEEEEGGSSKEGGREESFSRPRSQESDPVSPHLRVAVAVASHDWTVELKTKAAAAAPGSQQGGGVGWREGGGSRGIVAVRGQRTLTSFPHGEATPHPPPQPLLPLPMFANTRRCG